MASVLPELAIPKLMAVPECALTVLVVEDDPFVRRGACQVLREAGFEVVEAETAAQARAVLFFGSPRVDAMVCDAVLPDGCGIELCRRLRAAAPQLHVILTSGYPGQPDLARSASARFLAKPYSRDALIRELRQVMADAVAVRGPLLPGAITDGLQNLPG